MASAPRVAQLAAALLVLAAAAAAVEASAASTSEATLVGESCLADDAGSCSISLRQLRANFGGAGTGGQALGAGARLDTDAERDAASEVLGTPPTSTVKSVIYYETLPRCDKGVCSSGKQCCNMAVPNPYGFPIGNCYNPDTETCFGNDMKGHYGVCPKGQNNCHGSCYDGPDDWCCKSGMMFAGSFLLDPGYTCCSTAYEKLQCAPGQTCCDDATKALGSQRACCDDATEKCASGHGCKPK